MTLMEPPLSELKTRISELAHIDEPAVVKTLLEASALDDSRREQIRVAGVALVRRCRDLKHKAGTLDVFLQEFGLSNKEGIALMCLAESLLRVSNEETADRLIAEKILSGDWASHKGHSDSRFVNASVWGLMLTGKIVRLDDELTGDTASWMKKMVSSLGEPVIRRAVLQAMRIMGGQYVLGRTIEEAMHNGAAENPSATRYSFDMLGEGARTDEDALRYLDAYEQAINAICTGVNSGAVEEGDGISVKLSALHARYEFRQQRRVMEELLPRVKHLALLAKQGGIGFSIDAEEADRLELSLDIFEALARDRELHGWDGLGFVLQAYQKRAFLVTQWLVQLARDCKRRFMVRLVKGAYWDGEIKHAQEQGLSDYPVFTRKCHTDLSYQICTQILLSAPEAVYPQFATHNAHTVAMIQAITEQGQSFEFQRLHGMGHLLYERMLSEQSDTPVRVYAPVGDHQDLLPYLVRRLLENGANSSFVNRFLDARVPPDELMRDPLEETRSHKSARHSGIPIPLDLYQTEVFPWTNSKGIDLANAVEVAPLLDSVLQNSRRKFHGAPIIGGRAQSGIARPVYNPADQTQVVGEVVEAEKNHIQEALTRAGAAQAAWDNAGMEVRAGCLERTADLMEERIHSLIGQIVIEAGRTIDDALAEVREAVDFCRYYAQQGRAHFGSPVSLPGPTGEVNELRFTGRGVFLCISPWNFPLAIFTGQAAAALAAGNSVIAKPAEQTPLIAARAVELFLEAGIPDDVIHLLPGGGKEVAGAVLADSRVAGVTFTGSMQTAHVINRQLAQRGGPIVPFIAETGGLNVMLVDDTALPEQVVDDVITSAFRSAGQRCSALRVLYLQDEIVDTVIRMLGGAMRELTIGNPTALSTDIGPVIDVDARQMLEHHELRMRTEGKLLASCELGAEHSNGYFVAPQVYEIESLSQLEQEVFGPILHVIRYRVDELPGILADINSSGFGLTLGIHSRIDGFAHDVFGATRVGNTYINRDMVGAVVGVNPFGGQGLSGTGPKAGGPHYLLRFAAEKTRTDNVVAKGGNTQLFTLRE